MGDNEDQARHSEASTRETSTNTECRRPANARFYGRCFYVCAAIPLVVAVAIYFVPTILDEWEARYGYGFAPSFDLPPGMMDQFRVYDANGDGCLDPTEFVALGIRLREEVRSELHNLAPPTHFLSVSLRMICSSLRTWS